MATGDSMRSRVLDAVAGGVIALDASGRIVAFNRTAEEMFGVEGLRYLGNEAESLVPLLPEFLELVYTFLSSGAIALRAESQGIHRRNGSQIVELRFAPLGEAPDLGVAVLVLDRAAQRALEHAHERQIEYAREVERSFSRYLAPHVVRSLMSDPASVRPGGVRARATMLFADVRGFTQIALARAPEDVARILNAYFDAAVGAIFAHDGLLDKFYGDGLLAIFGVPRGRDDDARRAIAAARALAEAVAALGPRLGLHLEVSIGIATGEVFAGHIGSDMRMDYTVIGDAVNIATGLQSAAPPGTILCDVATIAAAGYDGPVTAREVQLKGRDETTSARAIDPTPDPAR